MLRLTTLLAALGLALVSVPQETAPVARNLRSALADERYSEALYQASVARFGARPPFSNIVHAEGIHAKMIEELMMRYKVPIPANPFAKKPKETDEAFIQRLEVPKTFAEACSKAADLERKQGPLYRRLSKEMPDDVQAVFEKLRTVSLERHLRAFQRHVIR